MSGPLKATTRLLSYSPNIQSITTTRAPHTFAFSSTKTLLTASNGLLNSIKNRLFPSVGLQTPTKKWGTSSRPRITTYEPTRYPILMITRYRPRRWTIRSIQIRKRASSPGYSDDDENPLLSHENQDPTLNMYGSTSSKLPYSNFVYFSLSLRILNQRPWSVQASSLSKLVNMVRVVRLRQTSNS
jgi:hypothetical protein